MAKGVTISLAAKCQLLFGLAVLVIIAGALAVPWQRMEQLAGEQNKKAARMLADATFRQIHAQASYTMQRTATQPVAPLATTQADSQPATQTASATANAVAATVPVTRPAGTAPATRPDWDDIKIIEDEYPQPRVVMLTSLDDDLIKEDPVTRRALEIFRARPKESDWGDVQKIADLGRFYRYALPIRLERSCLNCHQNFSTFVTPRLRTKTDGNGEAESVPAPNQWPIVGMVRVDLPWQVNDTQLLLNRIVIMVAGMLGCTLAVVVFYLITNKLILQPVRVLRNTAEKVSKGDLNIRSAISTGDEFQQLSETFNTMLATLKASQDQLESTNSSLDTRVGELAQMNVDLHEANRLKSEFLTNVSHELRTPLNAIIGFADLLAENPAAKGDAKIGRWVDNVRMSAKQLLDLINDLLDLAKIEAGKLVLRKEKLNVTDVCEAMMNFMKPLASKKNITITVTAPPKLPLLTTDPSRFQQILYNFMSNALKFTPQDGSVKIQAATDDMSKTVRVSVTDTGPGIAPEDQQVIFEKFRQLDSGITRQHSGTGLGLTISKELATLLGGRIELVSSPGMGATFTLVLPVESAESETESPTLTGL